MATNTRNVLVGAADLFVSTGTGSSRPDTKDSTLSTLFGNGRSARTGLLQSSSYREVGYTSTGLEVSYEPVYGEVMVDQLLDAARLFKQTLKVILKSELAEATLENLQLSWGQMDTYYANTGSAISSVSSLTATSPVSGDATAATLNMAAGSLGDAPVERVLIAVGNAPRQIGKTTDAQNSDVRNKERVYVARRVVNIDTTMHALKRDAATVFPVNFRCLPDDSDSSYAGREYGIVIDRVWGTN
jgi:hypothetical protein